MAFINGEGATHVIFPLVTRQACLRRGMLPALKPIRQNGKAGFRTQRLRKQRRLIIAPADESPPVQRYGNNQIACGKKFLPGLGKPCAVNGCQMRLVIEFERGYKPAAAFIIFKSCARPGKRRMQPDAVAAKRILSKRIFKGQAAAGAIRLGDEMHLLPAGQAQRAVRVHADAAEQALGREDEVKEHGG